MREKDRKNRRTENTLLLAIVLITCRYLIQSEIKIITTSKNQRNGKKKKTQQNRIDS